MRIIFAGTPKFAADLLESLIQAQYNIIAVYTQPDRPAGRGRKLQASAVKLLAEKHNLSIYQPESLKLIAEQEKLANLKSDLMVVAAYGLILPPAALKIPKFGCINVHTSILPAWRGASPIQQAILHGDKITGITIMQMDQGLDTGDILAIQTCPIANTDTSESLLITLSKIARVLLTKTIQDITNNTIKAIQQNNTHACYAPKINKTDALINWQEDASVIDRKIRAFYPWPMAYSNLDNLVIKFITATVLQENNISLLALPGKIINISKFGLDIACGNGTVIRIHQLQLPNKKPIAVKDLLNAHANPCITGKIFNNLVEHWS